MGDTRGLVGLDESAVEYDHAFDDLNASEIRLVSSAIRSHSVFDANFVFNSISLKEPSKSIIALMESNSSCDYPRFAECITIDSTNGTVYLWSVSLKPAVAVVSVQLLQGVHPLYTPEDCFLAEEIAKSDPQLQELLKSLGFSDLSMVACDPWSIADEFDATKRTLQLFLYARINDIDDNHYAHPINIVPVVDLLEKKVISIDHPPIQSLPPIPLKCNNFHSKFKTIQSGHSLLKPLEIVQPQGPSFTVKKNLVEWQNWRFRVGFNHREGLIIRDVQYRDCLGGNEQEFRKIVYRMSCSEMVVPYADPTAPYHRKAAKDVGDYGLGYCCNSLKLSCDCVGSIYYFDGVLNNHQGEPIVLENAVCMHEEDAGVLWKHMEYRTGHSETRRARKLVVQCTSTVVNYEYQFRYVFQQDGSIHFEIGLTGMLSTNQVNEAGESPEYGTLVMPGVNAQFHQHLFNVRLDMAVDGWESNSVVETDVEPVADQTLNPYGNAFIRKDTVLRNELDAVRDIEPMKNRVWKIVNPNKLHPTTQKPVAYKLIPSASPLMLAQKGSAFQKNAAFGSHSLWVTQFDENSDEYFAAGKFPSASTGQDGVAVWIQDRNAVIEQKDVVVWHTFGVTHLPRPEDFPVMPMETTGFTLKPDGFFVNNPSNDVPVLKSELSVSNKRSCCDK